MVSVKDETKSALMGAAEKIAESSQRPRACGEAPLIGTTCNNTCAFTITEAVLLNMTI